MWNLIIDAGFGELVTLSQDIRVVEPVKNSIDTSPVPIVSYTTSKVDVTSCVVQYLRGIVSKVSTNTIQSCSFEMKFYRKMPMQIH